MMKARAFETVERQFRFPSLGYGIEVTVHAIAPWTNLPQGQIGIYALDTWHHVSMQDPHDRHSTLEFPKLISKLKDFPANESSLDAINEHLHGLFNGHRMSEEEISQIMNWIPAVLRGEYDEDYLQEQRRLARETN